MSSSLYSTHYSHLIPIQIRTTTESLDYQQHIIKSLPKLHTLPITTLQLLVITISLPFPLIHNNHPNQSVTSPIPSEIPNNRNNNTLNQINPQPSKTTTNSTNSTSITLSTLQPPSSTPSPPPSSTNSNPHSPTHPTSLFHPIPSKPPTPNNRGFPRLTLVPFAIHFYLYSVLTPTNPFSHLDCLFKGWLSRRVMV